MPSGIFDLDSNTFIMDIGSFPKWWAPIEAEDQPWSALCKRTSTLYSGCGCIECPTSHSRMCKDLHFKWDAGSGTAELFKYCEGAEATWAIIDRKCDNCVEYPTPFRKTFHNPNSGAYWKTLVPGLDVSTIKALYEREIEMQEYKVRKAAETAARDRYSAIKSAWETHISKLSARGQLHQQPNVTAFEEGMVYTLTVEHAGRAGSSLAAVVRCQTWKEWIKIKFDDSMAKINEATETARSRHDKAKCMLCLTDKDWCDAGTAMTASTVGW